MEEDRVVRRTSSVVLLASTTRVQCDLVGPIKVAFSGLGLCALIEIKTVGKLFAQAYQRNL